MWIDRKRVRIRRHGVRGDGELSQHPWMVVPDFFAEIVLDDRVGFLRCNGEIGGGHPINKVPFEHGGVASDDSAAFGRCEVVRVGERRAEGVDYRVELVLDW